MRVVDTDAAKFVFKSPVKTILSLAETEKKSKYLAAAEARHASFTPFVVSVNGVLGYEANSTLQCLAEILVS